MVNRSRLASFLANTDDRPITHPLLRYSPGSASRRKPQQHAQTTADGFVLTRLETADVTQHPLRVDAADVQTKRRTICW